MFIEKFYCSRHCAEWKDTPYSKEDHEYVDEVKPVWEILILLIDWLGCEHWSFYRN
jgi:hypothetical protein